MVLMQAISHAFCQTNLSDLLQKYFNIVTGKGTVEDFSHPILHRCLSHVMKNAKTLCKKHVPSHYKLAMHTFGLLTSASTLAELDEMLLSCTVLFSSPCSSENVEKHFKNLQTMLTAFGVSTVNDSSIVAEDFEGITCQTPFQRHFNNVIESAPLDLQGPPNVYYSGTFLTTLATHFLPQAALWTSLMLGDLGRHGEGVAYQQFSKRFSKISKKTTQNFTKDNKTQGIMEKSQWDLKRIRFQRRRLTRLDDFVMTYQDTHIALLREFADAQCARRKEHRIQTEKWKQRKRNKRGVYVCPIRKPFLLRSKQISMSSTSKSVGSKTPVAADDRMDQDHTKKQPDRVQKTIPTVTTAYASPIADTQKTASKMRNPVTFMTSTPSTSSEPPTSKCVLRKKTNTNERKVSVPVQVFM
ncbi:hypothetical protein SRHO_G00080630 [Serrasalmus rhombeus]